jgi:hypothetical protein
LDHLSYIVVGNGDEIMHIFAAPGAYIRMPPRPPPFTIMRR